MVLDLDSAPAEARSPLSTPRPHLDVGHDALFGAKVQHLLRVLQGAHQRAAQRQRLHQEREPREFGLARRRADHAHLALRAQQAEQGAKVVRGRDRVDDAVEAVGGGLQRGLVVGRDERLPVLRWLLVLLVLERGGKRKGCALVVWEV